VFASGENTIRSTDLKVVTYKQANIENSVEGLPGEDSCRIRLGNDGTDSGNYYLLKISFA
jgi:hypothetical protein